MNIIVGGGTSAPFTLLDAARGRICCIAGPNSRTATGWDYGLIGRIRGGASLADHLSRPCPPRPNGGPLDSAMPGDLVVVHLVDQHEFHDFSARRRQTAGHVKHEVAPRPDCLFAQIDLRFARTGRGEDGGVRASQLRPAVPFPNDLEPGGPGEPHEPRTGRFHVRVRSSGLEGRQSGLLDDVLGAVHGVPKRPRNLKHVTTVRLDPSVYPLSGVRLVLHCARSVRSGIVRMPRVRCTGE